MIMVHLSGNCIQYLRLMMTGTVLSTISGLVKAGDSRVALQT